MFFICYLEISSKRLISNKALHFVWYQLHFSYLLGITFTVSGKNSHEWRNYISGHFFIDSPRTLFHFWIFQKNLSFFIVNIEKNMTLVHHFKPLISNVTFTFNVAYRLYQAKIYFFMWNMFKVNNKITRMTLLMSFWCFYY